MGLEPWAGPVFLEHRRGNMTVGMIRASGVFGPPGRKNPLHNPVKAVTYTISRAMWMEPNSVPKLRRPYLLFNA